MRRFYHAVLGAWAGLALCAPAAAQSIPVRPRLAVVIQADGLTSEMFRTRATNLTGGLGRLARGAVFATAPIDDAEITRISAAFGDGSLKIAVSGSAESGAALFPQRWHWDGQQFSGGAGASQSRIVPIANAAIAKLIGTAEPALIAPPACAAGTSTTRFARAAGDSAAFSQSPALDAAVLAMGVGLVGELRMGSDSVPDLLLLQLPATGRVMRAFGASSQESCLQLLSLDRDLAGFFSQLDRGGVDYVVVMAGSAPAGQAAPLVFWGRGIAPLASDAPVSPGDLAPTVSAWLGLPPANPGGRGHCLRQVAGTACPS